jgi:cell division protein FtsZ
VFEIIDMEESSYDRGAVIKVVGVGGAGCSAVGHMIREGVHGVEFVAVDSDAMAVSRSIAETRLLLGTGFCAGVKLLTGRIAALEAQDLIAQSLKGADMVFIVAGLGGSTGTGVAPIVAEVARELGILTVAVVTRPFRFEGKHQKRADAGAAELKKHVDSMIVILNDKFVDVLGDDVSMDEALKASHNVLRHAVGGIAEIINFPGLVNVDFEDVCTVMGETGIAMMGSANASGVERARIAAEQAVASPLLEGINLSGAQGVLVNITSTRGLKMSEVNEVMNTVRKFAAEDAHIIFGAVYDESMGEEIRVTVVATGLGKAVTKRKKFEYLFDRDSTASPANGRKKTPFFQTTLSGKEATPLLPSAVVIEKCRIYCIKDYRSQEMHGSIVRIPDSDV